MTLPTELHPSTGDYYRTSITDERRRYTGSLAQASRLGSPKYIIPTDFYDWDFIRRKALQRFAGIYQDGVVGAAAWRLLEASSPSENFIIQGGDGTTEGPALALIGGHRVPLFEDVDYCCSLGSTAALRAQAADQIHHRYSKLEGSYLYDYHAKWTPGSLVGLTVQIGTGTYSTYRYTITANTETRLTLSGFTASSISSISPRFYYIRLDYTTGGTQNVYIDVHEEDWGAEEDTALNHNPGGETVESMRRNKLIQMVWVEQVGGMGPTTTYVDSTGATHYVLKIGEITRSTADILTVDIDNDRNENGGSPPETAVARLHSSACVPVQPTNLGERLEREEMYLTVGDGSTSYGIFNGTSGLVAALQCGSKTVFLKNGVYDFSGGGGQLEIPTDVTLIGESLSAQILVDETAANYAMVLRDHARVQNVSIERGTGIAGTQVAVALYGDEAHLVDCYVEDIAADALPAAVRVYRGMGVVSSCNILKQYGCAVQFGDGTGTLSRTTEENALGGVLRDTTIVHANASTLGAFDNTYPAVDVRSGVHALIDNCVVTSDGQALRVRGTYATFPANMATQTGTEIRGSHFQTSRTSSPTEATPLIHLQAAMISFHHNTVDARGSHDPAHTSYGIYCSPEAAGYSGSVLIRDNFVRGFLTNIAVSQPSSAYDCEVLVAGNTVLPESTDLGSMTYGISVVNEVPNTRGRLVVSDNLVVSAKDTTAGIRVQGSALVQGNNLDGYAGLTSGWGLSLYGSGTVEVQGNYFNQFASGAILSAATGVRGSIHGNLIRGRSGSVTDYGVYCAAVSASPYLTVHANVIEDVDTGVICAVFPASGNGPQVTENTITGVRTGVYNCAAVVRNQISATESGIEGAGTLTAGQRADIRSNVCRGAGIRFSNVHVVSVVDNFAGEAGVSSSTGELAKVYLTGCNHVSVLRNELVVPESAGISSRRMMFLDAALDVVCRDNVCRALDANNDPAIWEGAGIVVTNKTSAVRAVVTDNVVAYEPGGTPSSLTSVGHAGIHVTRGSGEIEVCRNKVQGGSAGSSSLYYPNSRAIHVAASTTPVTIRDNTVSNGIHYENGSAGGDISGNKCTLRGVFASALNVVVDNNDIAVVDVSTTNAMDASAIWCGTHDGGMVTTGAAAIAEMTSRYATITGNTIRDLPVGTSEIYTAIQGGTAPFTDETSGRPAGIVARSDFCTIERNTFVNGYANRLAILVGVFDKVDAAIGVGVYTNRMGAAGGVTIRGNTLQLASQIVVVGMSAGNASLPQRPRGAVVLQENVWRHTTANYPCVFIYHDVNTGKGTPTAGTMAVDQLDTVLQGNSAYSPFGTVAAVGDSAVVAWCGFIFLATSVLSTAGAGVVALSFVSGATTTGENAMKIDNDSIT